MATRPRTLCDSQATHAELPQPHVDASVASAMSHSQLLFDVGVCLYRVDACEFHSSTYQEPDKYYKIVSPANEIVDGVAGVM